MSQSPPFSFPATPVFSASQRSQLHRLTLCTSRSAVAVTYHSRRLSFRYTLCTQSIWMDNSSLVPSKGMYNGGKWVNSSTRKATDKLDCCSDFFKEGRSSCSRLEHKDNLKGQRAAIATLSSLTSFIFLRLTDITMACSLLKICCHIQALSTHAFDSTNLSFASLSGSRNKPTPLKLDVTLPSIRDLQWGLSRTIYLFNMQVESNVGTLLLVLLVACFSFVVIGGFIFFKFRSNSQSLEDCFWEAWACLISSSTHLRV